MPQQLDSIVSTASSGISFSTLSTAPMASNAFWWQWPCSSAFFGKRAERQIEAALLLLAREEFLQQHRIVRQRIDRLALHQRRQFVAEAEQAARLQPDHRHAARDVRRERVERALHLASRLVDLRRPTRNVRPQHSGRPSPSCGCTACTR